MTVPFFRESNKTAGITCSKLVGGNAKRLDLQPEGVEGET